jgi:hypothetical protein
MLLRSFILLILFSFVEPTFEANASVTFIQIKISKQTKSVIHLKKKNKKKKINVQMNFRKLSSKYKRINYPFS